jgi:hypothetical protein
MAAQTDITGPAGSGFFGVFVTVLPNGNFVVVDPNFDALGPIEDVGAAYLYDGATLSLISSIRGNSANDNIGNSGVVVLTNGNFVVRSPYWRNGSASQAGAVTWGSATTGFISGVVAPGNSLVGATAGDRVGGDNNFGVTGPITRANSVLGTVPSIFGAFFSHSYDVKRRRLFVGRPFSNILSIRSFRTYFDFDGDGKDDISVFRPSTGYWYLSQSTNGFLAVPFGTNGDLITPGDYDGDRITDIAVFRPSIGYWYIQNSKDSSFRAFQFGQSGDIPTPGDYDGDGRTDMAVFRPSTGTFYVNYSTDDSFHYQQWGLSDDRPLMGDYDGDNKTDFAVFRPSIGTFYILQSSNSQLNAQQFGQNLDKPIAGDFDGDGKTEVAVFRPGNGGWFYFRSSDGAFRGIGWGAPSDIPTAADYDGDGMWDVAVYRPSTNAFYIYQSSTNTLRGEYFGTTNDVPVESAYTS